MSFALNGKTLDAGSYALNTQGYAEDQALATEFTSLGSFTLQAQYSGDSSYNSSAGTSTATVTQAPTSLDTFEIKDLGQQYSGSGINYIAWSGQTFHVMAAARDVSVMPAPTGAISFLENGSPASGTIVAAPLNGSYSGGFGSFNVGYLNDTLATSINSPGTYTFTASYPGDANYSGSQSPYSLSVIVQDTTFNITPPIPNVTIAAPGRRGRRR